MCASSLYQKFETFVLNTILDVGEMEAVRTDGSIDGSGGFKASWETRFGSGSDVGAGWSGKGMIGS